MSILRMLGHSSQLLGPFHKLTVFLLPAAYPPGPYPATQNKPIIQVRLWLLQWIVSRFEETIRTHQGKSTAVQGLPLRTLWIKNPNFQAHRRTFPKERSNIYLDYIDWRVSVEFPWNKHNTKGETEERPCPCDQPLPFLRTDSDSWPSL